MSKLLKIDTCGFCVNHRHCPIEELHAVGKGDKIPEDCPLPDAEVIMNAAKDSLDGFDEGDEDMPDEMREYGMAIKAELKKAGVEI